MEQDLGLSVEAITQHSQRLFSKSEELGQALTDILEKMNEKILELNKICQKEKLENANRNYTDQVWTIKDFNGGVRCTFSFSNNSPIT